MKVKELYEKYNGYSIMLFGKPLKEQTIPFSFLPKKPHFKMEVVDYKVDNNEAESISMNMGGKWRNNKCKGTVKAFVR